MPHAIRTALHSLSAIFHRFHRAPSCDQAPPRSRWGRARAWVISARVVETEWLRPDTYGVEICYEYVAERCLWRVTSVTMGDRRKPCANPVAARLMADKLPAGACVDVFYDLNDPNTAVLALRRLDLFGIGRAFRRPMAQNM